MVFDFSSRFAAPLILNPPAGTSSKFIESCLDAGGINCLLSVRRLDGITAVGCAEKPFVAANRLSSEGAPSPLPVLFLGFFADRGESWARLSRLFDAVLGPANIAF